MRNHPEDGAAPWLLVLPAAVSQGLMAGRFVAGASGSIQEELIDTSRKSACFANGATLPFSPAVGAAKARSDDVSRKRGLDHGGCVLARESRDSSPRPPVELIDVSRKSLCPAHGDGDRTACASIGDGGASSSRARSNEHACSHMFLACIAASPLRNRRETEQPSSENRMRVPPSGARMWCLR